ncbi:MAG: M48 family metallopeptidase [Alphaproteobacteria bacterium]
MDANLVTGIFLAGLAGSLALQFWLGLRHLRYVAEHRGAVPEAFRDSVSLESHAKAADYTIAKTKLNLLSLAISAILLLIWTLGGGLDLVDRFWRPRIDSELWRGVAAVVSVLFLIGALDLPLSLYSTFGLEQRFGFNRTTPWLFALDLVKGAVLGLAIGVPLIFAILWIMQATGDLWWLYAWAAWMTFALVQILAYPTLIAPLFNRFTPLTDESLRERVDKLALATGFAIKDIFVMDGSRRSAHGNAYLTGFGTSKRIVFFDTLLSALQGDEVIAVLAHELGHYKLAHIQKKLIATALMSLAGWALLGWLSSKAWFYAGLGVTQPSNYMALLLFMMVGPVFAVFLRPVLSNLSRRHEFEADDYARGVSDAAALARGLVKLYRDNANSLTPDPVYSAFYHTHPPPALRIRNLQAA